MLGALKIMRPLASQNYHPVVGSWVWGLAIADIQAGGSKGIRIWRNFHPAGSGFCLGEGSLRDFEGFGYTGV